MRIHFIAENNIVACGKNDHDLGGSLEVRSVTCKACKYTIVYRRALAAQKAISKLATRVGFLPYAFWENYIHSLPGKNSLPRGH